MSKYDDPRVHPRPLGKEWCSASQDVRDRASRRGFVATTKLRAKLHRVKIVQHDSSWCHAVDGNVIARFDDVSAAIAAL